VSPTGEIKDVIFHLCTMVGGEEELKQNAEILTALRKWYETHRYHINLPSGKTALVTTNGHCGGDATDLGQFTYYDDVVKATFSFDPFDPSTGSIISDEPFAVPTGSLRDSLIQEAESYGKACFKDDKMLFAVNQQGDDEGHQIIEISCQNHKLDAFWAGEW